MYAIEQVVRNLRQGLGPRPTADWLVDVCENLAEQAGDFIDEMMDKIVRLEDEILEHRTPSGVNGRDPPSIDCFTPLFGRNAMCLAV